MGGQIAGVVQGGTSGKNFCYKLYEDFTYAGGMGVAVVKWYVALDCRSIGRDRFRF